MKVFILAAVAVLGALGGPASRNQCPTLDQIGHAFEEEFGHAIPDGTLDCLFEDDNCPYESFEDFAEWFEGATGIELPTPDEEFENVVKNCIENYPEGCPSIDDVINFVQNELGITISQEHQDLVHMCADDIFREIFG